MPNMNEDHLVQCPYYKTHNRQVIHCEGFEVGMVMHAAFSSYEKQVNWKSKYCRKMSYRQCPIAKALDEKYEYK